MNIYLKKLYNKLFPNKKRRAYSPKFVDYFLNFCRYTFPSRQIYIDYASVAYCSFKVNNYTIALSECRLPVTGGTKEQVLRYGGYYLLNDPKVVYDFCKYRVL